MRRFSQVDVFSATPYLGNALAVVHDADGLTDEQMRAFANWTNLSETTFLLPPTTDDADYRVRIFTSAREMPFAGHPTIGTCHAWLEAGGQPRHAAFVVQECGVGLVRLRRTAGRLAFAAPPLIRSGPVDDARLDTACAGLGITRDDVVDHAWVDNGPGSFALLLRDADAVLAVQPDPVILAHQHVGIAGRYPCPAPGEPDLEVRFFAHDIGVAEDPVTGSLNAGLAQWLISAGHLPSSYLAAQGQVLGRAGRIQIETVDDVIWVGGDAVTCITGTVNL